MRNLKRALSLALASVMLLGMMVVGTSAASYPDVDDNDNVEAIEVLNAVNVMIGEQGNFNPDSPVNRHQMAVIMAKLYLGPEAADSYVGSHPFTDVVPWADKYVAACYENGIVAGTSATTFGGGSPLTAVQAAAMMLRALGYVNLSKGADNWSVPVTAKANEIRLFAGVATNPKEQLTRNQVAQLALNTLQSTMVTAKGGNDIQIGDVTIPDDMEYTIRIAEKRSVGTAIDDKYENGTAATGAYGYTLELGEHLYNGNLRKTRDEDGFQAPATRWSYKNVEVGTYTDAADYAFEGAVKSSAMYTAVGKTVAENYKWEVYMDGKTDNLNGDKPLFDQAKVKANNSDDLAGTGNGTVTYVYLDNTTNGSYAGTATVTILNTYGAEVSKVKDGKITLDDKVRLEVEIDGYAEGDVVLYHKYLDGSNWKVGYVLGKAELVEGEATTVRTEKFVKIGDKTYNYNAQFNTNNGSKLDANYAGQDVALYIDGQGNIVYLGDAKEGTDYAFVIGVGESAQYNADKPLYGAELMLADGTYKNVLLDKDLTDDIIENSKLKKAARADDEQRAANLEAVRSALVGRAFAYSENKDGSFDLTSKVGTDDRTVSSMTWTLVEGAKNWTEDKGYTFTTVDEDGKETKTTIQISGDKVLENGKANADLSKFFTGLDDSNKRLRFDSETVFILNDYTDGTTDYNVYTGYKNVPDVKLTNASTVSAYKNASGMARVVYITNASIDTTKDVVFIVGDPGARTTKHSGTTYYEYKAVVNGEVRTVEVKDTANTDSNKNTTLPGELGKDEIGVYAGITFNEDGYVTKLKEINDSTKLTVEGPYNGTNNEKKGVYSFGYNGDGKEWDETYAANDKVVIVYYGEYNNKNNQLHIETRLDNDKNDEAWVVLDDGDVAAIFVIEVKDDDEDDGKDDYKPAGDEVIGTDSADINAALKENGAANVKGDLDNDDGSKVAVGSEKILTVDGDVATNANVSVSAGGTLSVGGNVEGTLEDVKGTVDVKGNIKDQASVSAKGDKASVTVGGIEEGGKVSVTEGATATVGSGKNTAEVTGDAEITNDTITVSASKDGEATKVELTGDPIVDTVVVEDGKADITVPDGKEVTVEVKPGAEVKVSGDSVEIVIGGLSSQARTAAAAKTIKVTIEGSFAGKLTGSKDNVAEITVTGDLSAKADVTVYPADTLIIKGENNCLVKVVASNSETSATALYKMSTGNSYGLRRIVTESGDWTDSSKLASTKWGAILLVAEKYNSSNPPASNDRMVSVVDSKGEIVFQYATKAGYVLIINTAPCDATYYYASKTAKETGLTKGEEYTVYVDVIADAGMSGTGESAKDKYANENGETKMELASTHVATYEFTAFFEAET